MDGRPVLSCMTLAIECEGHRIETIEQINKMGHPLVQAYADNHAMQCGYCTPGFVVTAKALLDRNANPSKEEIISALEGNICRCGTYPAHVRAVQDAAKRLQEKEAV
jgi:aerobic-type carbon monoxide dehydrogenase small subunit (CoxS/CutS family)